MFSGTVIPRIRNIGVVRVKQQMDSVGAIIGKRLWPFHRCYRRFKCETIRIPGRVAYIWHIEKCKRGEKFWRKDFSVSLLSDISSINILLFSESVPSVTMACMTSQCVVVLCFMVLWVPSKYSLSDVFDLICGVVLWYYFLNHSFNY